MKIYKKPKKKTVTESTPKPDKLMLKPHAPANNKSPGVYDLIDTILGETYGNTANITIKAFEIIRERQPELLEQGWSLMELYNYKGKLKPPQGMDYGLICFLNYSMSIGKITSGEIEVITEGNNILKYRKLI